MNDAMEHVADPEGVLKEVLRVLNKKGKLYVNFPPYNHPFGAHLSDAIYIPWVHMFFSEKTLIKSYKSGGSLKKTDNLQLLLNGKKPKEARKIGYANCPRA